MLMSRKMLLALALATVLVLALLFTRWHSKPAGTSALSRTVAGQQEPSARAPSSEGRQREEALAAGPARTDEERPPVMVAGTAERPRDTDRALGDHPKARRAAKAETGTKLAAAHAATHDAEPSRATAPAATASAAPVDAPTRQSEKPPVSNADSAKVSARLRNHTGSMLRLTKISYFLDGAPIATQDFADGASAGDLGEVSRVMQPGGHVLSVVAEYQGSAGLFSYFDGYRYRAEASRKFDATSGSATQITVLAFERGGPTVAVEKRLALAFKVGG
jgi:hypothetical protein